MSSRVERGRERDLLARVGEHPGDLRVGAEPAAGGVDRGQFVVQFGECGVEGCRIGDDQRRGGRPDVEVHPAIGPGRGGRARSRIGRRVGRCGQQLCSSGPAGLGVAATGSGERCLLGCRAVSRGATGGAGAALGAVCPVTAVWASSALPLVAGNRRSLTSLVLVLLVGRLPANSDAAGSSVAQARLTVNAAAARAAAPTACGGDPPDPSPQGGGGHRNSWLLCCHEWTPSLSGRNAGRPHLRCCGIQVRQFSDQAEKRFGHSRFTARVGEIRTVTSSPVGRDRRDR